MQRLESTMKAAGSARQDAEMGVYVGPLPGSGASMDVDFGTVVSTDVELKPGESVQLQAHVTNNGTVPINASVIWRLSGTDVISQEQTVEPGNEEVLANTVSYEYLTQTVGLGPGEHTLSAVLLGGDGYSKKTVSWDVPIKIYAPDSSDTDTPIRRERNPGETEEGGGSTTDDADKTGGGSGGTTRRRVPSLRRLLSPAVLAAAGGGFLFLFLLVALI